MLIKQAQQWNLISGLVPHLVDGGLELLQYADDSISLLEDGFENARNLKFVLCIFEQISGLKINFHKIEVYCLGETVDMEKEYSETFTCSVRKLAMQYSGMLTDVKRLSISKRGWGGGGSGGEN